MAYSLLDLLQQEDRAKKDVDATEKIIGIYLKEQSTSDSKAASIIEEILIGEYEVLTERKNRLSESRKAIRQYLAQL